MSEPPIRKYVSCATVPPFGWHCCMSCHEDEDEGYDTLYAEDAEIAPGLWVGVRYCCRQHDAVQRRIDKLTARLGGSGARR